MNTFSAFGSISKGWNLFKKRPGFFVGVVVVVGLFYVVVSLIFGGHAGFTGLIGGLISIVLGTYVSMGLIALFLKAYEDPMSVKLADLYHPHPFISFLAGSIIVGVLCVIGFILLIVPGIIAALVFFFVKYLIIDRNMGPIAAMEESLRITRGNRWELFVFLVAVIVMNIVGALCLLLGLLVSIPVTMLASIAAYRTLEHAAGEMVPVSSDRAVTA